MYTNNIQVLDYCICLLTYKQYFTNNTAWGGICSLLKIRVILRVLTLLNPNMTTRLPYHLPMLREKGLN